MKSLLGYWLDAIGQTMSAIANTPLVIKEKALSSQLDLWGNVLQGTGTALISEGEEEFSLERVGNQLESLGNVVTIASFLSPFSDEVKMKLDKQGDIIETLGVSIALPDELQEEITLELFFDIYGHFLQVIEIKEVDEDFIDMIAEWSQAIASIHSLMNAMQADLQ